MADNSVFALTGTAAFLGITHTLAGPDHYIPFIAMARAQGWTRRRVAIVTMLCGVGHVGSSVVIGFIGIGIGMAVGKLEWIESVRGGLAGWLLLAFGLAYMVWGLRHAMRNRSHTHWHTHADGTVHRHTHAHHDDHVHAHDHETQVFHLRTRDERAPLNAAQDETHGVSETVSARNARISPWVLFTIFVFGPCEVLIPLLMVPASQLHWSSVIAVTAVFGIATIGTMLAVVFTALAGLSFFPAQRMERYTHAAAGAALAACALAIQFGL